jgi:hypothetical protein
MNKIIKNFDLTFDEGGRVTFDQYTSQGIKKAYVSIRIRYESGRAADDKFYNKYELKSFDEKPFEELKDHKLKGILGVSTSNYNLSEWLVHRECLVVMPFDKFKELNDTEQIQYYDADYLSKNGFDALHRLYDRKGRTDDDYGSVLQNIFPKITQELHLEGMSIKQGSDANIYVIADWFNIYNSSKFFSYVVKQKRINSPEELAQIVIDYANSEQSKADYYYNRQTENISIESIIQPIIRGIVQSGKIYVDESEWLIKNKELVIPENSQLFFVIKDYENMRDKYDEYISRYNLSSSYKIAFINQKNLNELQSKRWNLKSERSKEEFEKAKTFTQKRIVKAIQKIQNDVIEEWTNKLIEEFKESYSNEVFKDYDGNSYSDNILEVPSAIIYFDSLILKFIDIYDSRVDYIAQSKSKYAFSDIFNDFSNYIDGLRSKEGEEELEVKTSYNRVYKYDILQKLYYYTRHIDYNEFGQKIKNEIGSDLYRYFSKDEVGFKNGGELKKTKMNKKILCPVGTEVQSLIFSKDDFTEKSAKDWAKNHDFKYGYIDEKENTYRIRQQEPSDFENMRTIEMTEGVKAVIGCPIDKYADGGAVGEIKIGDEVHARWNDSMQWTLGTFIGETENGFEVYNFKIEEPKYIEYYAQITKDGHNRKNNKIYESKNFKNRNYKNYNFKKFLDGGIIVSNDIYEFVETKHTKTGDTIYVLRIKKRLSPAEYKIVESNVKLIRGYYSGFVKGFVLKSKITDNEIQRLFEGTSLANITEKTEGVLTGGKADKLTIQDIANKHNVSLEYAQEQLKTGIQIEAEHTDDVEKQAEISLDHLSEFIDYYVELQKMEKKLEGEQNTSIINQNTDLLGNPKEVWMLTAEQFSTFIEEKNKILGRNYSELKPLFEKYSVIKNGYEKIREKVEENPLLALHIAYRHETSGLGYTDVSYLKRNKIKSENARYIKDNIQKLKTKDEFYKYIKLIWYANQKSNENYQNIISDASRLSYTGGESKEESKSSYKRAILDGKMTVSDAVFIVDSANLKVPDDVFVSNENERLSKESNKAPFKFNEGEYVSIIDEPISNNENIYRVVGHQNYNNTYGWETTIKNLYSDESVTMFENMLQISNKSEQIKEIINELKDSFSKIEQESIDLHLKVRLDALENEAELEKAKEIYPIVIEWSEGNIPDNTGVNNLDELNEKLKQAGFTNSPNETYVKNKVLFRGYPHYIRIENGKSKGDFNFEKQHVRDYLKNYEKLFDWSIFDKKEENKIEVSNSQIEELEMLIELTEETLKESPNEDVEMYLELLKNTLEELKNK